MGRWRALIDRAQTAGIEAIALSPRLRRLQRGSAHLGLDALRAALRIQLAPEDVARFMIVGDGRDGDERSALRAVDRSQIAVMLPCRRGAAPTAF